MPKQKLGELIDLAFKARATRLAYQAKMDAKIKQFKAEEARLEAEIVNSFTNADIEAARGSLCTASVSVAQYPKIEDWDKFYAYVKKHDAFDLLERRPAKAAFRERWDDKVQIPGTTSYTEKVLHLNKISKG